MSVDPKWIRNPSDTLAIEQGCYFDESAGAFVCDFIERFCRQSKGSKWAGQPLTLLDWQRDFLMRLFGWRRPDGTRRFRRAYIEVAKKNGKTTLLAALELILLIADDDGPEIYINACDRSQAGMMYEESKRMVEASPDLKCRLKIVDYKKTILYPARNGMIRANSADAPNKDGLNPSGVIFDELHRQPDTSLWDIFEHADAAREQPLWISITTAGEDDTGVWYEQREYSENVNAGITPDITHLGIVYRADPEDDIDAVDTWRKANPSLGVTISEEAFRLKLEQAKETPRKLADFKRLRLNIISKSDSAFIPVETWDACKGPVDPDSLAGKPCYFGLDLSKTTDLTALALLFGDQEEGYEVLMRFWLPGEDIIALERRDRQKYRHWAEQGHLILTDGPVIDYGFVRAEVNELARLYSPRSILVDPHNATHLNQLLLEEDGLPVQEVRQGFISLSPPTKELERLVLGGKIRHGGHPVLRWNVSNAVAETDASGNVKLSKRKSRLKIDGAAALVNALAGAIDGAEGPSSYESEGILFI